MEEIDIYIIRTRWSDKHDWCYEICSEKDIDRYEQTKSDYSMCICKDGKFYQELQNIQFEIIYQGKVGIGKDLNERLFG